MAGWAGKAGKERSCPSSPSRRFLPFSQPLCFLRILSVLHAAEIPWGLDRIDQRARQRSTGASSLAPTAPASTRTSSTPACAARTVNSTDARTGLATSRPERAIGRQWTTPTTAIRRRRRIAATARTSPASWPDERSASRARCVFMRFASSVHRDDTHRFHGRRPGRRTGSRRTARSRRSSTSARRDSRPPIDRSTRRSRRSIQAGFVYVLSAGGTANLDNYCRSVSPKPSPSDPRTRRMSRSKAGTARA